MFLPERKKKKVSEVMDALAQWGESFHNEHMNQIVMPHALNILPTYLSIKIGGRGVTFFFAVYLSFTWQSLLV